jgi:hypothetical protein
MLTLLGSGQGQSGTYVELMLQAYKFRVYAEAGVFEAEECLKTSLKTLDGYQVDPNAQIVRDYASRVRAYGGTVEAFESTISSIKDLRNKDLYDRASLTLFPSGAKSGTIFSLQPESVLDNNLIVNGNFSENETNWTKTEPINSTVTFTNNQLTFNRGSNSSDPSVRNIGIGIKGKTYKITFEVVSATVLSNNVGVSIGGNTFYLVPSISSVGIKEIIITATETSPITIHHGGGGPSVIVLDNISAKEYLSADLSFNRNTTKTRTNGAGLIETVAANVPSLNYDTIGGASSLLLEPQRTNLVLYSDDFSKPSWIKNVSSVLSDQAVAPNGTFTSDKLIPDSGANVCRLLFNGVNVSAGSLTFSIFVKVIDFNFFFLREDINNTLDNTIFDLTLKTIPTLATGRTASITEYINGYLRIQLTATSPDTTIANLGFGFCDNGTSVTVTGDGVKSGLIWGAQLEQGSYETSYIPTLGSAVTRNQDLISKTGISDLIGQTEGVLFVESATLFNDGLFKTFSISNGTTANSLFIQYTSILNQLVVNGNTQGAGFPNPIVHTLSNDTLFFKIAVSYTTNKITLFVNGLKIPNEINGQLLPINFSRLGLDTGTGGSVFLGKVNGLQLYKTALTDAECIALTSP